MTCQGYCTPLHCAAEHGHTPVVKALIEAGADVDKKRTVANISAPGRHQGHAPVITELIKAGADVNATDDDGSTPLHYAVKAETRIASPCCSRTALMSTKLQDGITR